MELPATEVRASVPETTSGSRASVSETKSGSAFVLMSRERCQLVLTKLCNVLSKEHLTMLYPYYDALFS